MGIAHPMIQGRYTLCVLTIVTLAMVPSPVLSIFSKRGYMDPKRCESFCDTTGIQGSVGSCNCGYIMFSKRSGHAPRQEKRIYKLNRDLFNKDMFKSLQNTNPDDVLAELSTRELLETINILDKINSSQNTDYINDLSEKEVKTLLWMLNWIQLNN